MGTAELAQAIVEYGVVPVVLAVVLGLLILMIKKINAANEAQSKRLDAQEERLTALTQINLQAANSKIHSKEEEDDSRRVNMLINSQLDNIIKTFNANRAFCVAYHNGGTFLNSRNFAKCSIIAESVDNKTRPIITEYQNVQRALFLELDTELAETGDCEVTHLDKLQERNSVVYQLLQSWGTHEIYFKAVVDYNTHVVLGFIAAEYNEDTKFDKKGLLLELSKTAQRISGAVALTHSDEER